MSAILWRPPVTSRDLYYLAGKLELKYRVAILQYHVDQVSGN
jgi:hypothetical protein